MCCWPVVSIFWNRLLPSTKITYYEGFSFLFSVIFLLVFKYSHCNSIVDKRAGNIIGTLAIRIWNIGSGNDFSPLQKRPDGLCIPHPHQQLAPKPHSLAVQRPMPKADCCLQSVPVSFRVCTLATLTFVFIYWRHSPQWARASSFTRFLDHT